LSLGPVFEVRSPSAAARGNNTKLLPVSRTVPVLNGTRLIVIQLRALRLSLDSYNDGYADNLSLTLGPFPGPAPPASLCSVSGTGGGGSGAGGGSGGGTTGEGTTGKGPTGVLSFGKAVVGADGKARISVRCNTRQVSRCKGTLSVALVRATQQTAAKKKKAKRGLARYSIPSLEKRTIKVPLRRSDARKVRKLSAKQLAKRRLRWRATTTVGAAKLKQTSLLIVKRKGR
jgi:hypothetical protein